jgi:hypothetical protein
MLVLRASLATEGRRVEAQDDGTYVVRDGEQRAVCHFTLDREAARERGDLELLGLDHPLVQQAIKRWQATSPEGIGVGVSAPEGPGVLTWWFVEARGPSGEHRACVLPLGVSNDGSRNARLERFGASVFTRPGHVNGSTPALR